MRSTAFFLSILGVVFCCGCRQMETAASNARPASAAANPDRGRITLPANSPKLARIQVVPVRIAEVAAEELLAPGKVEVNPNRVSRITVPVVGRIREVAVKLGDSVDEGQTLATMESAEAGAALAAYAQARAGVRQAKSSLGKAEKDLSRLRDLHENRAAALKDVLAAETDLTQAQAEVEQAQAELEAVRYRLESLGLDPNSPAREITVRAPIVGKILEIAVAPGEYRSDTTAALMTIADLRTVWVASEVPESSIRLIDPGERIEIEFVAYPGEKFQGRVRRIADTVDAQTRTVKVQAELDNRGGRLRPEMFGSIRHSHGTQMVAVVPASAVIQGDGEPSIFVERTPGTYEAVRVQTGDVRDGMVPVLAGLNEGDRVVADGAILLKGM